MIFFLFCLYPEVSLQTRAWGAAAVVTELADVEVVLIHDVDMTTDLNIRAQF